jgi:hypothetical protein
MALRPPQHRVDAPGVYIVEADEAWDREKIDADKAMVKERLEVWARQVEEARKEKLPEPPKPPTMEDHPITRYQSGETRYDLNAPLQWDGEEVPVTRYLNGVPPTRFHLRRLPIDVYARCEEFVLQASGKRQKGEEVDATPLWLDCVRHGISHVDGEDFGFELRSGKVTDAALQTLIDMGAGTWLIRELGLAVWRFAQPLTPQEKKV